MQSKKFRLLMHKVYSFGASIVILGAMFKILHLPGAGLMLGLGLTTEAIIFFLTGFDRPHEEPDWSLVYPELAGMDSDEGSKKPGVVRELEHMLERAQINQDMVNKLGEGLKSFGSTVNNISKVAETGVATDELNDQIKAAADKVSSFGKQYSEATSHMKGGMDELGKAYSDASKAIAHITASVAPNKEYQDEVEKLAKNLSSLNAVYEVELRESNNHMKTLSQLYGSIAGTMKQFQEGMEETKRYRAELNKLTENLTHLNSIYGNMLSAMTFQGKK